MNATASRVWSFCTTLHDGDKNSLNIFWLKDKSFADLNKLPEPDELAGEIIENLEAGLESFRAVAAALA